MMPKANAHINWVNCLHIYQPPWQSDAIVHAVTKESYAWLIAQLKSFPHFKATLNISGTLLETLDRLGYRTLINDLKMLLVKEQIELTGSSQFHAFLPELPESEIIRQIELHETTLAKYFDGYKPTGFFPPELAYSPRVGEIIKKRGYTWLILDPMSTAAPIDTQARSIDAATGLAIIFRDRTISKTFPPETIYHRLGKETEDSTIITATDGELYGHFHTDWQDHLKQVLASAEVVTSRMSDYLGSRTAEAEVKLHAASWETRTKQLKGNNPFSIWYNKENPIHQTLWDLAHTAIRLVQKYDRDANLTWARQHLDRGLASCSWWWASEIKTSPFAPLAWNPDEIEHGALELIKAIRSLHSATTREKIGAEKIHLKLLERIWEKHWKKYGNHS